MLWLYGRWEEGALCCSHTMKKTPRAGAGRLVQEVTEHEQVVYGSRARDRGPVRKDRVTGPAPGSLVGAAARAWARVLGRNHQGLHTAPPLTGHSAIS